MHCIHIIVVAGRVNNSYGDYADYAGMVSEAKLAFFDIGDAEEGNAGGNLQVPGDINTDMFSIMYTSGARVFTNSWGTSTNTYDSYSQQSDRFMWENKDALLLFSAGNSGASGSGSIESPSICKNAVAVGATLNGHDSWLYYEGDKGEEYGPEAVAGFSSQGPTRDRRLKPDVLAPGFWTTSAEGKFNSSEPFCSLIAQRGTSMACPTAAGFAMKIRAYFMEGYYPSGQRSSSDAFNPSGALLKAMLVQSSQPMKYSVTQDTHVVSDISATYPSNVQGYGRIDMSSVLNFEAASTAPLNLFVLAGATSSDQHYEEFTLSGQSYQTTFSTTSSSSPIRITMVYTDYYSSTLSSSNTNGEAMQNILSLSVSPGPSPLQVSGTVQSNVQVIDIPTPSTSTVYTVTVSCDLLSFGPQPFALVISGANVYVENVASADSYSVPEDNFTAGGGAMKYIIALGLLTVLLGGLVWFFRRISKKKTAMMLDPRDFEATDGYYEEDIQDTGRGGRKSVFATIRNIRSQRKN